MDTNKDHLLISFADSGVPPNQKFLTSLYFFIQGIGSQLPQQAVLSTLDFFKKQYPNAPLPVGFTFPGANSLSSTIIIFFMVLVSKRLSLNARIAGSNYLLILFLTSLPFLASFFPGTAFGFWVSLFVLFMTGFFFTTANGSVAGLGALFPAEYRSKNAVGSGCAGIFTNVIRAIILTVVPADSAKGEMVGVYIYYTISAVILLLCIVSHYAFVRSDYAIQILSKDLDSSKYTEEDDLSNNTSGWGSIKESLGQLWEGFKEIKLLCVMMVIIMIQSSMVFPGLVFAKKIEPLEDAWKNTIILLICNVCDTIGKYGTLFRGIYSKNTPIYMALFRISFYFIFITTAITQSFPIIDENWFFFLSVVMLATSGGFSVGILNVMIPEYASEKRKETSGFLGLMCLMGGATIGSYLSIPLASFLGIQ